MSLKSYETIAVPDYGAAHGALSSSLRNVIRSMHSFLKARKLQSPIEIEFAVEVDTTCTLIKASSTVRVDMRMVPPGSKLKLAVRDVDFIIVDAEMNEALRTALTQGVEVQF